MSAIGKQFRLAFLRKSTKSKAYAFIWPALLCCLAGISFVYDRKYESDYKASLDDWAMRNKEKLASFTLRDVQSTISNKPSLEWHLERPAARSVKSHPFRATVNGLTLQIDKLSPRRRFPAPISHCRWFEPRTRFIAASPPVQGSLLPLHQRKRHHHQALRSPRCGFPKCRQAFDRRI